MIAVQPLAAQVGVAPACQALGVSRASFYRRQRSTPGHQQPRPTPARALCEAEREQILDVLAGPRFVDRAPAEVVATLLDEGHYLCSERTMYRILAADQPVRERRNQREHPQYTKPELVATAPNQTWSWDITKLLGPTKWTYFYLYVVLDIFSRYAVGWMVADRENSALAGRLIEETCHKQCVQPGVTSSDGAFVRGVAGPVSAGTGQVWRLLRRVFPARFAIQCGFCLRHPPCSGRPSWTECGAGRKTITRQWVIGEADSPAPPPYYFTKALIKKYNIYLISLCSHIRYLETIKNEIAAVGIRATARATEGRCCPMLKLKLESH